MKFRAAAERFIHAEVPGVPSGDEGEQVKESAELNAFLGKGCVYEGKLTFEGRVRIDGRFVGEIFTNDILEVGRGGEVRAEIDVSTVIISGDVQGNIHARTRVELKAPARVRGNITTPVLTMDEGAAFDGNLRMDAQAPAGEGVLPGTPSAVRPVPAAPGPGGSGGGSGGGPGSEPRPGGPTLGLKPVA